MQEADLIRIKHVLDASNEIIEFSKNKKREDLNKDRKLSLSLVRLLEIVGEAASGCSNEFQKKYPNIPWKEMVGMRNRLIHGYFEIDLDIVWKTITVDIPPLIPQLKQVIESEEE